MSEQHYKHLTHEDTIQAGDEFWTGSAWIEYHEDHIGKFVLVDPSRRPIANAIDQPQRERIAYEELRAGDIIQKGDEWWPKDGTGQWQAYHQGMFGLQVLDASIARRPYRVSTILEIGDALADAQKAATQLQDERNEFQTALIESRLAQKRKVAEVMEVCKERDNALTALKSAQRARDELQRQVDELRAEHSDEPTAWQVRDMLRTWATELDWLECCFDATTRDKVSAVQI